MPVKRGYSDGLLELAPSLTVLRRAGFFGAFTLGFLYPRNRHSALPLCNTQVSSSWA
jgi:hypothetical protein